MSSPTKFLDLLNSTLRPTERINTVTGFYLWLFRLVVKIAKGFSVVKRSEPRKHQSCKDLSHSDRSPARGTAVLSCFVGHHGIVSAGFSPGRANRGVAWLNTASFAERFPCRATGSVTPTM